MFVFSLLLDKLLARGVRIGPPAPRPALAVPQVEAGRAAVDVVLAEGGGAGGVIRSEHVCFLARLSGESLLREALILHQVRVRAVLTALRKRERVPESFGVEHFGISGEVHLNGPVLVHRHR